MGFRLGFYGDLMGFYSDIMGYEWDVPSGNLMDKYGKINPAKVLESPSAKKNGNFTFNCPLVLSK